METPRERDVPLVFYEMSMARADRRYKSLQIRDTIIIIVLIALCAFLVWLGAYERLQYDYVDDFSAECDGVYNLVDADGNTISSDLTSEDIAKIMEVLHGKGNSAEDPQTGP